MTTFARRYKGPGKIEIQDERPSNGAHFSRLLKFCQEVLAACDELAIEPVLSGSLAVFGYTRDRAMAVNDIDLACSGGEFSRLSRALAARGIAHQVRKWHVLQVRRDDLKVEFDAMEVWMAGLPEVYRTLVIGGCTF